MNHGVSTVAICYEGIFMADYLIGLLNHDWSDWRSATVINNYVKPFVSATLK